MTKLALIGVGEIARNQHVPALGERGAEAGLELAAVISRHKPADTFGVPWYSSVRECMQAQPDIEAASIATPIASHAPLAHEALDAGLHVQLEKPPTATVKELEELEAHARTAGKVLNASFHAQHNQSVEMLAYILKSDPAQHVSVSWYEDFSKWHAGQSWPFESGGSGVGDPTANWISILARIFGSIACDRSIFWLPNDSPEPVRIQVEGSVGSGIPFMGMSDWMHVGPDMRELFVHTAGGHTYHIKNELALYCDGVILNEEKQNTEYKQAYAEFAKMIRGEQEPVSAVPIVAFNEAMVSKAYKDMINVPHPL